MSVPHTQDLLQPMALDRPRVLIVDDSRTMRVSVQRLLGKDFDVIEADHVDIAWDILTRDETVQVVFADLMMPDKNGFQLLRQMRESPHERLVNLPVIVITGHEDSEKMMRQAMLLGATDFISKPFDSIQLRVRAQTHAKHQDTARRLQEVQARLTKGGTLDTLTGLANQRYFSEQGPSLLAFAARERKSLAVLRLNIDEFETLFRKKGKHIADKVLLNVTRIITGCVREEDRVARVGLAKFAIVMPGVDRDSARHAAQRIHHLLRKTAYRLGDACFHVTASGALVTSAAEQADFHALVKLAEERLMLAVYRGGNQLMLESRPQAAESKAQSVPHAEAEVSPAPLAVDQALALIESGQDDKLRGQIESLMVKLYPLIAYGNRVLKLEMDEARLRQKLRIAPVDVAPVWAGK